MPGDPLYRMLQDVPHLRPEDYERLRKLYGFDDPVYVQYWEMALAIDSTQSRLLTRIRPAGIRNHLAGAQKHSGAHASRGGDRENHRHSPRDIFRRAAVFHG